MKKFQVIACVSVPMKNVHRLDGICARRRQLWPNSTPS